MTRIKTNNKDEMKERIKLNNVDFLPRSILPNPSHYNIDRFSHSFKVAKTDYMSYGSIQSFIEELDMIFKAFLPIIDHNSVIFDIGAMVGSYSLSALALGAKKVIAFEPHPEWIKALNNNVDLNHGFRERFICIEKAISDQTGQILSFDDLDDVLTTTIDSFIDEAPTYIKIDIDGIELSAIKGGLETIKKYRPIILIEHHVNIIKDSDKIIQTILESMNYKWTSNHRDNTQNIYHSVNYPLELLNI